MARELESKTQVPAAGVGILDGTSPVSLEFQDKLYVFYTGSGNDGIWYTVRDADGNFSPAVSVRSSGASGMGLAKKTQGAAAVYNNKIYLFFNGSGMNGTYCTTYDGNKWSEVFSVQERMKVYMNFYPETSPSVTVRQNTLHLFWYGSGDNGIFTTRLDQSGNYSFPENVSELAPGIGLAKPTSPAAVTYRNKIYVFYNGSGNNGTWYTTFDGKWSSPPSRVLADKIGFLPKSSPSAVVMPGEWGLRVFWAGSGGEGTFYSTFTDEWSEQKLFSNELSGQSIYAGTAIGAAIAFGLPFYFWADARNGSMWSCTGNLVDLDKGMAQVYKALNLTAKGSSMTVYSTDPAAVKLAQTGQFAPDMQRLLPTDNGTSPAIQNSTNTTAVAVPSSGVGVGLGIAIFFGLFAGMGAALYGGYVVARNLRQRTTAIFNAAARARVAPEVAQELQRQHNEL